MMNPDAVLEYISEVIEWHKEGNADGSDMERALNAMHGLDEWITGGGHLPTDWAQVYYV